MDWTEFVTAEPHGIPPDETGQVALVGGNSKGENLSTTGGLLQFLPEGNQCRTWLTWSGS